MMRKVSAFLALVLLFSCAKRSGEKKSEKVLSYSFSADIKGFDPVIQNDEYSGIAIHQVYEGLLRYNYLKRPYELEPHLAVEMPVVSKDGLTYSFNLRPNVFFHDDPAFEGKPRPLRASDVVYSLKRIADPHLKSPNWWIFEGRIGGLDEFRKKLATISPPIDYDAHPVSGLSAPDEGTFILKLTRPYRQLLYVLAMPATKVVAKEAVWRYGDEFLNHAVGTGPFLLKEWRRNQKITFVRNPKYWSNFYPTEGMPEDEAAGLLKAAGKPLPFIDTLVIWIYTESQPRWLNFIRGNLDLAGIPKEAYETVLDSKGELTDEIKRRRIILTRSEVGQVIYFSFNMEDPIIGKNRSLRQAISCALNREEKIKIFYNNRAIVANGPIPPGLFGFNPNLKDSNGYNVERAKELMKRAREQYRLNGGEGDLPKLVYDIQSSTGSRQLAEAVVADLAKIGLRVKTIVNTWPQLRERVARKQAQFFLDAWQADYPDSENFFQLLYGKNESPGPNSTNFKNAEYDRLYEKMRDLPDGPERLAAISRMVEIVHEETPWALFNHPVGYGLRHAWVRNYKPNPISPGLFQYLDIDPEMKMKTLPLLK